MAYVFIQNSNTFIIHGQTILITNSVGDTTTITNIEFKTLEKVAAPKNSVNEDQEKVKCSAEDEQEVVLENSDNVVVTHQEKPANAPQDIGIICCCISSCGQKVAIADQAKRLTIWQNDLSQPWHLLSTRETARKCIKLCFCHSKEEVLAADRAGDVFSFSLSRPNDPGKLVLGHLSMILDMLISKDDQYVITSDRDEKIRVSYYPNAYNIQSYCLGHSEFVSALCLSELNNAWLISGSGDGTLRVWDYKSGQQLCNHPYMSDIESFIEDKDSDAAETRNEKLKVSSCQRIPAVSLIDSAHNNGLLAVLFDKKSCISIYNLEAVADVPKLEHLQVITSPCEPYDIKLDHLNRCILVLAPVQENSLSVYKQTAGQTHSKFEHLHKPEVLPYLTQLISVLDKNWETLKDCKKADHFQHLYKQWYDNVETYLEKKELRQNKKLKKNASRFKKLKLDT